MFVSRRYSYEKKAEFWYKKIPRRRRKCAKIGSAKQIALDLNETCSNIHEREWRTEKWGNLFLWILNKLSLIWHGLSLNQWKVNRFIWRRVESRVKQWKLSRIMRNSNGDLKTIKRLQNGNGKVLKALGHLAGNDSINYVHCSRLNQLRV